MRDRGLLRVERLVRGLLAGLELRVRRHVLVLKGIRVDMMNKIISSELLYPRVVFVQSS
jgi:hypothetical protein